MIDPLFSTRLPLEGTTSRPFHLLDSSHLDWNAAPRRIQRLPRAGAPPKSIWQTKRRLAVTWLAVNVGNQLRIGCHSRR